MKGFLIKDWKKYNHENPDHRALLARNLGRFLAEPQQNPEIKAVLRKIQEFGSPQDFPTSVLEVLEKFHLTTQYDTGWQSIFQVRDYTGSKKNGFDMTDVQSGLTFDKIPIGGKLEVHKMWGARSHVYFDFYGGALGWHKSLFDDEEYWTIEDNAIEFRNKAYAKQAAVFYALLEAVGATGAVAWQAHPDGVAAGVAGYLAGRDIATFNAAALQILLAVKDKGYGVTAENAEFVILVPEQLRQRAVNAVSYMNNPYLNNQRTSYRFRVVSTTMLVGTTHAWCSLPNIKLKAGIRMDFTPFSSFDMLSYTEAAAAWMRYGGCVGDTDQVVRLGMA